eukprot:CAMPEP_0174697972 /NCGR_PEP_ID=MMETSP1094-20130205/3689_1 /TAXON_ID=156173 /ORGANISM="Chrysochromulina brevifilum, Strain UTEX LB 985" /LENGTH=132 /DNA_ID=CAMNT_0015895061 /DNA_START=11 /DNA_END=409 /DNA_ORIENTATION=+
MPSDLLADKRISTAKLLEAVILGLTVTTVVAYLGLWVTDEVEEHYHIFHPERVAKPETINGSSTMLIALTACYPCLAVSWLMLVIPLLMYASDHAAFQSLHVLRPDHYMRLLSKVYTAWAAAPNGKLKVKDM